MRGLNLGGMASLGGRHRTETAPVRLDSLTGLRFFAAFIVFLSHAGGLLATSQRHQFDLLSEQGFVGVSFFYILSGFVLTWSHREKDASRAFYRRRFARIAPTYWVCLALGVLYASYSSKDLVGTVVNAAPSVLGVQAWIPVASIFYGGNAVGWSISCEFFFYLSFPLLILATRSKGVLIALATAAALIVAITPLLLRPSIGVRDASFWAVYIFPAQRLAEFVLGIALAAVMRRGWRSPVPLPIAAALAIAGYFVAGSVPFWAAVSLMTAAPFAILIASCASADLSGRATVFTWGKLVKLGEWSFSFYLIHQLVISCTEQLVQHVGITTDAPWRPALVAFALIVSVVAAGCLHRIVEHPMEVRLRKARPRLSEVQGAERN